MESRVFDCKRPARTGDCPHSMRTRAASEHFGSHAEAACENAPLFETDPAMDIERINQIGNTLADLSSRTEALRRYL